MASFSHFSCVPLSTYDSDQFTLMKKMEWTRKYLEYLRQVSSAVEDSGVEEKYRIAAFGMAATPIAEWVEVEESTDARNVVVKYEGFLEIADNAIVTSGYMGELFLQTLERFSSILTPFASSISFTNFPLRPFIL